MIYKACVPMDVVWPAFVESGISSLEYFNAKQIFCDTGSLYQIALIVVLICNF